MNSKDFIAGKKGYSHAAQEIGYYALCVLLGWTVHVGVGILLIIVGLFAFPQYWLKREIKQSKAMGRKPSAQDLKKVPSNPNGFWTQDAIDDVKTPEKIRIIAVVIATILIVLRIL